MTTTQELANILADVDRPGDYFVAGRAEFLAPRIEVDGVGLIALPLLPAQAKQLIKAATRAPFGRGATRSGGHAACRSRTNAQFPMNP